MSPGSSGASAYHKHNRLGVPIVKLFAYIQPSSIEKFINRLVRNEIGA